MSSDVEVAIETFFEKSFAEAAVSLLESEGIRAWVRSDAAGGVLPNLDFARGLKLLVAPADEARARAILTGGVETSGE